jgi:predicted nucleic acid-binding protein
VKTILVDSNVLLDILTPDPDWEAWSSDALAHAAEDAYLAIHPVIYSEVSSVGFREVEVLEDALPPEIQP